MESLPKAYDHKKVEEKWYQFWLDQGLFEAKVNFEKRSFSIVIPPPNVTGSLHMGHALNNTLQDILIRINRMKGYETLWLPGTDHAGIATQNVVEREIAKEGLSREDLGREKFVERVWAWKEIYGATIINQLKRLGCSCDWNRERFTMDDKYSRAVKKVFVSLYSEGLIYRGDYIINWCPRCLTALSDLEVERKEIVGELYYLKYPLKGEDKFVSVATTRPETMLGDTAVAVSPNDERYRELIGKIVVLPLVGREIPVIADEAVVEEFGTGAVKVTPAHDFNDFEIARRHSLPLINIFDEKAVVNENGGKYEGLDRYEARKRVVEDLKSQGLLEKVETYQIPLGVCYRCSTAVEPRLSKQWFVKMKPLAEPAIEVVRQGKVKFYPRKWEKIYFDWMENIRDWCISRQLWWGHRIPVWYCEDCKEELASEEELTSCPKCGSSQIKQDEDVLDTWFSSALWPFVTLGWPERTPELSYFYPTSVLVTSHDIIFFWVARMIMMGLKFMGDVPFYNVLIHTLVRDQFGQKMSKSKGNVIDPLEMIEKYGTDALRFTLTVLAVPGRDIYLSTDRVAGYRDFCNKIWNAARFVLMNVGGKRRKPEKNELSWADSWILHSFTRLNFEAERAIEEYDFSRLARLLYDFFWDDFCDWYLEISKIELYRGKEERKEIVRWVLLYILERYLRLLHPIMPFITEEIWQLLPEIEGQSIMVTTYPKGDEQWINEGIERFAEVFKAVVNGVRSVKAALGVPFGRKVDLFLKPPDEDRERFLRSSAEAIAFLSRSNSPQISRMLEKPLNAAFTVEKGVEIYLPLEGLVDLVEQRKKLLKELEKTKKTISQLESKLKNNAFLSKASPEVVEKVRLKYKEELETQERLEKLLNQLG